MEKLTRDDAISFYNKYYTPNNATLIISGDVTAEKVREMASDIYGKLPVRSEIGPRIRPQEPEKKTLRTVTMHGGQRPNQVSIMHCSAISLSTCTVCSTLNIPKANNRYLLILKRTGTVLTLFEAFLHSLLGI